MLTVGMHRRHTTLENEDFRTWWNRWISGILLACAIGVALLIFFQILPMMKFDGNVGYPRILSAYANARGELPTSKAALLEWAAENQGPNPVMMPPEGAFDRAAIA